MFELPRAYCMLHRLSAQVFACRAWAKAMAGKDSSRAGASESLWSTPNRKARATPARLGMDGRGIGEWGHFHDTAGWCHVRSPCGGSSVDAGKWLGRRLDRALGLLTEFLANKLKRLVNVALGIRDRRSYSIDDGRLLREERSLAHRGAEGPEG